MPASEAAVLCEASAIVENEMQWLLSRCILHKEGKDREKLWMVQDR